MSIVSLCRLRCCIFQLKRCQSINTWSFPSFMLHIRNWTKLWLSQLLFLNPILFMSFFLTQLGFYTTMICSNWRFNCSNFQCILLLTFHCLNKSLEQFLLKVGQNNFQTKISLYFFHKSIRLINVVIKCVPTFTLKTKENSRNMYYVGIKHEVEGSEFSFYHQIEARMTISLSYNLGTQLKWVLFFTPEGRLLQVLSIMAQELETWNLYKVKTSPPIFYKSCKLWWQSWICKDQSF